MANFFQDTINKARETFDKGYKTFIKPIIQAKNDFVADIRPGGYVGFTGQTAESLKPIVPVVQKAASQAWKDTSNAYQQVANQARKTIDPIVQQIPKSNILGSITKPFLNTAKDFTSATAETLQSTVDPKKNFVDPYKRMLFSGGKLAASPLAVANPLQTLALGGLSGGINQVFGDKNDPYRFAKGVGEGISSAGAYKAIGMLTNPMIDKISEKLMKSKTVLNALSKVPAGKKRDFINFLAERAAVGTLNIPEGVVMQKAVIPDAKYTVQDALIDFTLGAAVGKTGIRSAMQGDQNIKFSKYPIIKKQPIVPSQPPTTFSDQKSIDLSQQKPTEPEGIQLQKPPKGSGEGVPPQKPPKKIGEGSPPTKPPAQEGDSSVDGFISKLKAKFNKLYTETVNEFHPLNYVAKMAGKAKEMRHALAGYYGAGSTAQYHVDFELTQILKEQNLNDLREAAIAMRDIELASRGIKGSPKQKQALEKLKAIKERLGEEKMKSIGETLKKLYEYQDRMVKTYLVDTGIMSQIGYKNMRKNNNFYIPFKRVMDRVDEFLGFVPPSKGAGSVSSQDVIYSIKGSDKEIVDPIESILEATYKMVALAKRQEVAQTIVSLKDDLPEGMIKEIKGKVGNTPNISLFVNGKVKHYQVPIEVAEAAKGLNKEALATIFKILQYPTAVFRASATGSNPDFFVPNVLIDLQSAFVNVGLNPLKWVKGLAHMMKKDEIYQEFLKQGAKSTTRVAIDRPMLQKTVAEIAGDTKSKAIEVLKPSGLLKVLQTISEYSDTPTRIAVFEEILNEGLKKGLSREEALKEAAYWAQEATTNFSRHGSKTQAINALYAFLNARLQGVDRLLRSFKNDPVGVGFRVGLISQVPALVLYAWNRQFESYNDERVVSETDKKRKFIFMLSDTPIPQLGGAQYIAIPKGDIGQLANPTEEFLRMADNKGGDVKNALVDVLKAFSPVSNVGDIFPTALRPIIEVAVNKNFFFDKEIVPEYKKAYPAKYQDTAYTRPLYRMIGDKINASPAKIEALVHGYGTGLANIGERMTRPFIPDKYKTPQNEQGATINQIPVLRRFLGGERKTKEEQELAIAKRIKAIEFDINDIKGGIKRKEIPQEEGLKQIEILQAQQQELKNKLGGSIPESFFRKSRRIRLRKVRSKRLRSKRRFTSKRIKVKRLRIRRPSFA
jgi:flagellin-specific chaperone FliS